MYVLTLALRAFHVEYYRGQDAVSSPAAPPVRLDLTAPVSMILSPGVGYLQSAFVVIVSSLEGKNHQLRIMVNATFVIMNFLSGASYIERAGFTVCHLFNNVWKIC